MSAQLTGDDSITGALPIELDRLLELLDDATAVALAKFDRSGQLLASNMGFRRASGLPDACDDVLAGASAAFQGPRGDELVGAPAEHQVVHRGIINLGDGEQILHSLRGTIFGFDKHLVLVAEHAIDELHLLNREVITLNEQLSEAHRELARANRALKSNEERLRKMMLTDPLTGVANRRSFNERVAEESARHARSGSTLCLVMVDLDNFKRINDTFGHEMGDRVLTGFAEFLKGRGRTSDFVARFGGEEFVLILPATTADEGETLLQRVHECLTESFLASGVPIVTASFGVAELLPGSDVAVALKAADDALYCAKAGGRNQVAVSA